MKNIKRIFIVGQPGAGKGVVARAVADKLGWDFVDADFALELKTGLPIAKMFIDKGKDDFLACHEAIIDSLTDRDFIVITTDACIAESEKLIQILQNEFTVFIDVSLDVQKDRLSRSPDPLFVDENLNHLINQMHQDRDPIFKKIANTVIDSNDSDLDLHAETIINKIPLDSFNESMSGMIKLTRKDMIIFHKLTHEPVKLTRQQAVCLKLLSQGKSAKEIARQIGISYRTVEGYIAAMMDELGCSSSRELIALYNGYI